MENTCILLKVDAAGSVLGRLTPFGAHPRGVNQRIYFKHQRSERSSLYCWSSGYRFYLATLMRFAQPDPDSPSGQGMKPGYAVRFEDAQR